MTATNGSGMSAKCSLSLQKFTAIPIDSSTCQCVSAIITPHCVTAQL
jgi:hypothetical protein